MLRILFYVFLFLILGLAYVRYIERHSIFYPTRKIDAIPSLIGLEYEDIYFTTGDNIKLNGWLIKNPNAKSTLLFFHGNGGNISHRLDKIVLFNQLGLNVFIIDYRGYGESKGRPSEEGIYKDAKAAYDYLVNRSDIDRNKIISYGESLGGAVAIDLATHRRVACLIVEATFTNAKEMGKRFYPYVPSFLYTIEFDSVSKVKNLTIPKLFIHSLDDEIVPFSLGNKLFEVASQPKTLLKISGGHNDGFITSKDLITERVGYFLRSLDLI